MSLQLPEQSSRNRSDSTGDSGLPKHERKRPRLSENQGNPETDVLSTIVDDERSSSSKTSCPSSTTLDHATPNLASPPHSPLPTSAITEATSPQSKVTINTRPISSQSSTDGAGRKLANSNMTSTHSTSTNSKPSPYLNPHGVRIDQPETISISSSECGSPVIQVAAPEDLDQDPARTRWETVSGDDTTQRMPVRSGHVQRTFPYADQPHKLHSTILQIAKIFVDGSAEEEEIFQKIKVWLIEFVDNATNVTYEFFEEEREFWQKFPSLIQCLLKRKVHGSTGIQLEDLVEFFVAFIRLAMIFVGTDIAKMRSQAETADLRAIVNPHCPNYLSQIQYIVAVEGIPLYDTLHNSLNYGPTVVADQVLDQIIETTPIQPLQAFLALFESMVWLFSKRVALVEHALSLVFHAGSFVSRLSSRAISRADDSTKHAAAVSALRSVSSDFLQSVDAALDRAVAKQQPWLNIETCEKVIKFMGAFVTNVASNYPQMGTYLITSANVDPSHFENVDLVALASTAWRFATLHKFIRKGRMEVRVACVQIMAQDLVTTYHELIATALRGFDHPTIQFMTQFIRKNDIIRYLIGVDSHPQIIERCANIIGFLCVSHNYQNDDTDVIWQTIIESQDPRAVSAILTVFQYNLDNLDINVLHHVTQKLLTVPFHRLDTSLLDFVLRLANTIDIKLQGASGDDEDADDVDKSIIDFCAKMLRDACTPDHINSEISLRIRSQIPVTLATKIQNLAGQLSIGTNQDLLSPLFTKLCNDIKVHSEFAGGSALVLSTMLGDATNDECTRVVQEHDIASFLINDIACITAESATSNARASIKAECECRFRLMVTLIFRVSHTISEPLIDNLWTNVLSLPDLDARVRSSAWSSLASIFDAREIRNSVLDILCEKYLPQLSPFLYDSAVLDYVKRSVTYEIHHTPAELMEPQEIITIPGIERVWSIMLTVPSNTVENEASDFIIQQYLSSDRVARKSPASVEATYLALIDRSVQLVIDAATQLKANTDTVMHDAILTNNQQDTTPQVDLYTIQFHRALLFLRKFLDVLKSKTWYMPAADDNFRKTLSAFEKQGNTFEVTLQVIGHKTIPAMQFKWKLGYSNIGDDVWRFLSRFTGWPSFTTINAGKRLMLKDETRSLHDLEVRSGSFMISAPQESSENVTVKAFRAGSPVDNKVMHHFDELYNLLELDNKYAKEVFDFLSMFSSQGEVVNKLKSMSTTPENLLPVEKPFKLMYYARALRSCIEDESFSSEPNTNFLSYGIKAITSVLPSLDSLQAETSICVSISQGLIEALVLGFRARLPADSSISFINDGEKFNQDIVRLWSRALDVLDTDLDLPATAMLIRTPFEAIVEGLLHNERLWSTLPREEFSSCLRRSILTQSKRDVRQAILEVVHGLTGGGVLKSNAKSNEARAPRLRYASSVIQTCLGQLWEILLTMLEESETFASICDEYFEALSSVLREYQQKGGDVDLQKHTITWKGLLLSHQHNQVVGLGPQDYFTPSIGKLLLQAFKLGALQGPLDDSGSFIRDLFTTFMFPPLTNASSIEVIRNGPQQHDESKPVLDMHTRSVLYELILKLAQTGDILARVCDELDDDLLPKDLYFHIALHYDRQSLRSEPGYSGLRNLSNTCYLNSLLSQLFMNIEFRELVMNVNIIDHTKQKLVAELGKVFAYMQTSYEEAVSPENAIDAITLWDGNAIDVSVQMDVDEFFNVLFDRLETQIVDPKVCHAFKAIYGGQLVQQIKSKECEHVSERLEPFTAVQVEIKGKSTLEESLRAYVEGEVLQGENKYSCTGCGKHVDAVKRACLKTIPNHLIFNLKRFDYDIMTGTRGKVNDEFCFPDKIDMAPYTLEALSRPSESTNKDTFDLVGIIIHSGTAESGHYYSYIRQRPSSISKERSWVQFNDHDVSQFDPASISECCFGGIDFGAMQCPKFYNGYMLFYQRSTSIQEFEHKYHDLAHSGPVRLPASPELELSILQHNELFLRSYVAQDATHAKFLRMLLQQTWSNDQLRCSQGHADRMTKLLTVALDYVSQVSARWKELPEVEETLALLRLYATECLTCAKVIIKWFMKDSNLVDNIVRSYYGAVRKHFTTLAMHCWKEWTKNLEISTNPGSVSVDEDYHVYLREFLLLLANGWEFLQRHSRAWENYFGLLEQFIRSGSFEARKVIEAGFLEYTLEFIHVHLTSGGYPKRLRIKYSAYLLHRERNRPFQHNVLIEFLFDLLQIVDFTVPETEHQDRTISDGKVSLSMNEAILLGMAGNTQNLEWLRKIIFGRQNPAVAFQIVKHLCETSQFDTALGEMLKDGVADRALYFASACLPPVLSFVSHSSNRDLIGEVLNEVLSSIYTTEGQYSKDFLNFVQELPEISNEHANIPRGALRAFVKKNVHRWAPVLLMAPNDLHADVRGDALELLNDILFKDMEAIKQSEPRRYRVDINVCKVLARSCRSYIENTFIAERAPSIQAGQGEQILRVLAHCLGFFGDSASDEDEVATISAVMEEFRARCDGVGESVTEADWNASSDLDGMSEADNMSENSN